MSAASTTQWEQYEAANHAFWDYLEEHEEILQEKSYVTLVCGIMEECPVVNFSCVRDLIYTMRQFLGEKRFKMKRQLKTLQSKIKECIVSIKEEIEEEESEEEDECMAGPGIRRVDLGVQVNSNNFLQQHPLTYNVRKEFTKRAGCLFEKQDCLRELRAQKYNSQVYGQDIYRQQALILNFNILRTFFNNLMRYYKLKAFDCVRILKTLVREAFHPEAECIQTADYYVSKRAPTETLTRISIWPLHEPVVSSYEDRKVALSQRWEAAECPKSNMPPIYTPRVSGDVVSFRKTTKKAKGTEKVGLDSIPRKIAGSEHFKRVIEIVKSGNYDHSEKDPTKKSNWLYYCVMFDPTVSPEAADQGYIGMTTRDLVTRWKEHVRLKGEMLIQYNLALVSEYARQRGEDLSEYVAVFALGTFTDESDLRTIEGRLIQKSFRGGFGVTNMKYGMNCKRSSARQ